MGRAAAAGGSAPPRGPFAVDHDRALAELELAWSEGGYHGFTASGGTWCAVTSAGEVLTGATSDELVRGGSPRGGHPAAGRGALARGRPGGRYVAASPTPRVILGRAGLSIFFRRRLCGALLPLTAHSALDPGSGGYGLLLGSVG